MKLTEKIIEEETLFQEKEKKYQQNINDLFEQINILQKEKKTLITNLTSSKIELNELYEKYSKLEQNSKNIIEQNNSSTLTQFLNKKFIHFSYDQLYVFSCLSKDISDYQHTINSF